MGTDDQMDRIERLLTATLSILIADRNDRLGDGEGRRSELVIADSGLSVQEIALVTGRKYEAVKSSLRRAKSRPASETGT